MCGFPMGCFLTGRAPVKLHCINERRTNPRSAKQMNHCLPRYMAELAMKSPDSGPHPGWEFPRLLAPFSFILRKSRNRDLINESFLRDPFLNWVHLGSIIRAPKGVKRLVVLMSFFLHIPHKSYIPIWLSNSSSLAQFPIQSANFHDTTSSMVCPRNQDSKSLHHCSSLHANAKPWSLMYGVCGYCCFSQRSVMETSMCRNLQVSRSHINSTSARNRPCPNGSSALLYPMAMTMFWYPPQ